MNNTRREIHYTIAWVAPLHEELAAAKALLDDRHGIPDGFLQLARRTLYLNFSADSSILVSTMGSYSEAWSLGAEIHILGIVANFPLYPAKWTGSSLSCKAKLLSSNLKSMGIVGESSVLFHSFPWVEFPSTKIVPGFDPCQCALALSHDLELFIASGYYEGSLFLGQIPENAREDETPLGKTLSRGSWISLSSCSSFLTVSDKHHVSFIRTNKLDAEDFTSRLSAYHGITLSKDSKYLATNLAGNIKVWCSATWELLWTFKRAGEFATFSPDSTMVTTWDCKVRKARVWLLETGKCLWELPCSSVAFTGDSKHVASVCEHLKVTFWCIETGEVSHTLHSYASGARCPKSCVPSLIFQKPLWDFSPDGQYLAIAWDWNDTKENMEISRTIRICRIDTDEIIATFVSPLEPEHISFEPVTGMLLTGNAGFLFDRSCGKYGPAGYSFTEDLAWITYNGRKLVWLPVEYRPVSRINGDDGGPFYAANASAVAYMTESRELKVIRFKKTRVADN